MMTPTEFALSVIGRPWVNGAGGPDAFDCWGLVRAFYREVRGVEIPAVDVDATRHLSVRHAFDSHPERSRWEALGGPVNGSAVLMSQATRPHHVGVYVEGAVLHSVEGFGVVRQTSTSLRVAGWNLLGYYALK